MVYICTLLSFPVSTTGMRAEKGGVMAATYEEFVLMLLRKVANDMGLPESIIRGYDKIFCIPIWWTCSVCEREQVPCKALRDASGNGVVMLAMHRNPKTGDWCEGDVVDECSS